MRTVAVAVLTIALLPAAAYSQEHERPTSRTEEQKKQDAEIEKAYKEVQKGIRAQTPSTSYDPWGTVRQQATPSDKAKR